MGARVARSTSGWLKQLSLQKNEHQGACEKTACKTPVEAEGFVMLQAPRGNQSLILEGAKGGWR